MTGNELRESFLKFFEERGHARVASSSLVPHNDPTLLFTNAGMNQFKDLFLGLDKRSYTRAVTAQKCVRAGGKHNDLDTVGRTARHHTFFEMMGNFSFGDYFKREAITYAWDFLTKVLGLPEEKLYITIYNDDDEAHDLWREIANVPDEKIIRMGEKDNFWSMGDTGPCGPCSEIHIDRGEEYRCNAPECALGKCECDRWLELWNLVFMQFNKDEKGVMTPLPKPSIDTGMGLERVASVLQEVRSNYDTDLLRRLIQHIETLTGKKYYQDERGFPFRVIADHARSCTFLITDGVLPSNEGRGYVLRRILRRAVRFVKVLGWEGPFLSAMVPVVVELMGEAYPELKDKQSFVQKVIFIEEERFHETLSDGVKVAGEIIAKVKEEGRTEISGEEAFTLYDTFGFPLDLTEDIAEEQQLKVDQAGFAAAMEKQRQRARAARSDAKAFDTEQVLVPLLKEIPATEFVGYGQLSVPAKIQALVIGEKRVPHVTAGNQGIMILDHTPFYAEKGGQVGDVGLAGNENGRAVIEDTQTMVNGQVLHHFTLEEGSLAVGDTVNAQVSEEIRKAIARNHTATHIIHRALRMVVGDHAHQAGSLVGPDRLRFDFSHFAGLTPEELAIVEDIANQQVLNNLPVATQETGIDEAKAMGATALFGEKYGDQVRVVTMGDFTMELCGGTHCQSTGEVGCIKIISEAGIGAGLRRIEAATGHNTRQYFRGQERILQDAAAALKTNPQEVDKKVEALLLELKAREKEIEALQAKLSKQSAGSVMEQVELLDGVRTVVAQVQAPDMNALRTMADMVRDQLQGGVIVLAAPLKDKVNFVVMVSPDLVSRGLHAGNIVKEVALTAGGGGGGRPDMAQAGGKNPEKTSAALAKARETIKAQLQ